MEFIKAITIRQPWASLIVAGIKKHETRTWQTPYRGFVVIHAGKTIDKLSIEQSVLLKTYDIEIKQLPLGAALAIAHINFCEPSLSVSADSEEKLLGYFSERHYAIGLTVIDVFEKPIPMRGQLGLWNYPISLEYKQKLNQLLDKKRS